MGELFARQTKGDLLNMREGEHNCIWLNAHPRSVRSSCPALAQLSMSMKEKDRPVVKLWTRDTKTFAGLPQPLGWKSVKYTKC